MTEHEDKLIARLKAQIATEESSIPLYHRQQANPPIHQDEIERAENMLGFALPPLLKRIYLEVGDGGFGPAYGLFKLNDEGKTYDFDAIVQNYFAMRSMTQDDIDTHWADEDDKPDLWPEKLIIICDWGCNMYSHIDCASPEYRVLHSDSNISMSEFAIESPSFLQWVEGWLDGKLTSNWDQTEKITFAR